jgi:hypothetical protein
MASLTNPIKAENIIARFADFTAATANAGIVWADNANPVYTDPTDNSKHEVVSDTYFAGTTAGLTAASIGSADGILITAADVVSALVSETNRYTVIRKVRAKLNVTGAGGNKPGGPVNIKTANNSTPLGVVYDQTKVAHMAPAYGAGNISQPNAATYGIARNQPIDSSNLESYMAALRDAYVTKRNTVYAITTNVCHASCHNSCHGSRSRR